MLERRRIAICLFLLAASVAGPVSAAELAFVLGTIVKPEGVNEGDVLPPGTVVQSGDDALVMVEHRWPSETPSRDCVLIAIFGYGQSYTVSENATPGRCQTTVPTNLGSLQAGQPFLNQETRYGDAKYDEGRIPDKVNASQAHWSAFDRWVRDAQRTFTGVVTSVSGNRIRLRSPRSNNQKAFSVNPSTVDTPVAVDTLIDKSVRLDYRIGSSGAEAVRIRLASTLTPGNAGLNTSQRQVADTGDWIHVLSAVPASGRTFTFGEPVVFKLRIQYHLRSRKRAKLSISVGQLPSTAGRCKGEGSMVDAGEVVISQGTRTATVAIKWRGGAGSKKKMTDGFLAFYPSLWETAGYGQIVSFSRAPGYCYRFAR